MASISRLIRVGYAQLGRGSKCAVALLFSLTTVLSFSANALSLGEVEVQSKLNEPFSARIEVLSASAAEIGSLRVGLAGEEAWKRAGLVPQGSASQIRFGFVATGGGNLAITLKTDQPVREPLLVFLVDAAWSSGHLLREYTVFLDPESLPQPTPAPVIAPSVAQPPQLAPASPQAPAQQSSNLFGQSYGPVQRGESLGQIAEKLIAGSGVRRNQMIWALFQLNPAAFTDNNINWLNVGVELQVPTAAEAAAISPEQASRLVGQAARKQEVAVPAPKPSVANASRQTPAQNTPEPVASEQAKPEEDVKPEIESEPVVAPAPVANEPVAVDKLELLPLESVDEDTGNSATVASAESTTTAVAPETSETQVATSTEFADAAEEDSQRERELAAENALLRERINETEALLKEIRGLLAARSEQLADLQERLERVESTKATSTEATKASNVQSAPIGWFWWLLLVLAVLILLLLVALLFVLTRRQNQDSSSLEQVTTLHVDEPKEDFVEASARAAKTEEYAEPLRSPKAEPSEEIEDPVAAAIVPTIHKAEPEEEEQQVAAKVEEEHTAPEEPKADEQLPAEASETPVLDEQREAADDTPLEFDISGYAATTEEDTPRPEAEPAITADDLAADIELPELESFEDFDASLSAEETEEPNEEALDEELEELSLPDLDLQEPAGAFEVEPQLDAELPELEADEESPSERRTDVDDALPELIEPAADEPASLVSDSDLETMELDAGISIPGESLEEEEVSVPAIDGAMDVSEFSGGDQVATKLDLARVYADMGDAEEAQSILAEVLQEGDASQKAEAQAIIDTLG